LNKADALLGEGGVLPDPAEWVSIHEEVTPIYALAISATKGNNTPKLLAAIEKQARDDIHLSTYLSSYLAS